MTERSIRIVYFCLDNFNPLYESMGLTKFEFSRYDSTNKIVMILGGNGMGKSFIMTELTPLPLEHVTFRGTSNRIIPGKDGRKYIEYNVDNKWIYKCEIFYPNDKKTQCFFRKKDITTGEETELNPNGNVTSYIEMLEQEFGLVKNYTNIGYFSSSVKSIVEMSPTERNNLISTWLPDITDALTAFKVAQKKYNQIRREIESLSEDIGKITVDEYTNELNRSNYALKDREDRLLYIRQKVSEGKLLLNTTRDIDYATLKNKISSFKLACESYEKETAYLQLIIKELEAYSGKAGKVKLAKSIEELTVNHITCKNNIEHVNSIIATLKTTIDSITPQINQANTNYTLPDIIESINKLNSDYKANVSSINKLEKDNKEFKYDMDNETNTKYQLLLSVIYDVYHIANKIDLLTGNRSLKEIVTNTTNIIDIIDKKEIIEKNKLQILKTKMTDIENRIYLLKNNKMDSTILSKTPTGCNKETCPILKELYLYTSPDAEISKLTTDLSDIRSTYDTITTNIEETIQKEKSNIYMIISSLDDINNILFRNKEIIAEFPEPIVNKLSVDIGEFIGSIEFTIEYIKRWDEYISICEKNKIIQESIHKLENIKSVVIMKNDKEKELNNTMVNYNEMLNKRESLIATVGTIETELSMLNALGSKQEELMYNIDKYKKIEESLIITQKQLVILNKRYYYKRHLDSILNNFIGEESSISNDISILKNTITDISNKINSKKTLEERRDHLNQLIKKYEVLMNVWNPRTGYPSYIIQGFMDTVKDVTNRDLNNIWGGILAIKEFIISNNEFSIPYQKGNTTINDVSEASSAERSTLSLALSIAIIEINSRNMLYNIIRIDESDGAYDEKRREMFLDIITSRLEVMGCSNCFIISHNKMLANTEADVILLPGHGLDTRDLSNKNILFAA